MKAAWRGDPEEVAPRGQGLPLGNRTFHAPGVWFAARSGEFIFRGLTLDFVQRISILCWMSIGVSLASVRFSQRENLPVGAEAVLPFAFAVLSSLTVSGEFPPNSDLSFAIGVVGGRCMPGCFDFFHMVLTCDFKERGFFFFYRGNFPAGFCKGYLEGALSLQTPYCQMMSWDIIPAFPPPLFVLSG